MARDVYTATITVVDPSVGRAIEPNGEIAAQDALLATAQADSTTAKASAATAVTDVATALTDLDAIATDATNGIVALLGSGTGGTYAYAAHQITGSADTTPSISQAQADALVALFNTAMTAVLAAQTSVGTAKTDADTSDTAVQAVSLTAAAATVAADVTLLVNLAAVATKNALRKAVAAIMLQATNNASGLT